MCLRAAGLLLSWGYRSVRRSLLLWKEHFVFMAVPESRTGV
jgi:hypothetical protein